MRPCDDRATLRLKAKSDRFTEGDDVSKHTLQHAEEVPEVGVRRKGERGMDDSTPPCCDEALLLPAFPPAIIFLMRPDTIDKSLISVRG